MQSTIIVVHRVGVAILMLYWLGWVKHKVAGHAIPSKPTGQRVVIKSRTA